MLCNFFLLFFFFFFFFKKKYHLDILSNCSVLLIIHPPRMCWMMGGWGVADFSLFILSCSVSRNAHVVVFSSQLCTLSWFFLLIYMLSICLHSLIFVLVYIFFSVINISSIFTYYNYRLFLSLSLWPTHLLAGIIT